MYDVTTRECPFCGSTTMPQSSSCWSCNQFINFQFPFEIKGLSLTYDGLSYRHETHSYKEIVSLYFLSQSSVTYFIPTNEANLRIRFDSREKISLSVSGLANSIMTDLSNITLAHRILRRRTIENRMSFYLRQFDERGYVEYKSGYDDIAHKIADMFNFHISDSSIVRIYANGIVEQNNRKVDLAIAKRKNLITFGTKRGGLLKNTSNPDEIVASETGLNIINKKIAFSAYWDYDIISYIIEALSTGKT